MEDLDLNEIKYFEGIDTRYVIDSLTQVISREYIEMLAKKMLDEKIPFTLMILDLDNFKQINDSFGHSSGDFILKNIGEGLRDVCRKEAYVGRFGGDEFLLLIPNKTSYNDVHHFLENLYFRNSVFRRYYNDGLRDIFVTATLGCASFPDNASDFKSLFDMADKALYRGKVKGRNCYIIYVESKHKDIVIHEKVERSLIERFNSAKRVYEIYKNHDKKIKYTMDFLYSELHCTGAYFLTPNHELISNAKDDPEYTGIVFEPHLELLLDGDRFFYDSPLTKYKEKDKVLADFCNEKLIHALMIAKVGSRDKNYGYIMVYERSITRIWQESEIALLMYVSSLLENELKDSEGK